MGLSLIIKNEILAFTVLCTITAAAAIFIFIKKPKLLGGDIEYIQEDFLQMFHKKNRNNKAVSQVSIEKN
jgi:hypothetical protein